MSRSTRTRRTGLDYRSFIDSIERGDLGPLYLLIGEEVYLQEQALRMLCDTIDESCRPFNLSFYAIGQESSSGIRITAASAIDAANQLPMMSARRIVVIRDFDKLKEDDQQILISYLERPSPTTTVVFQTTTLDKRRKLSDALLKKCTVVEFGRLEIKEIRAWALKYLDARSVKIQPRALDELLRLSGDSLSVIANELEKLACWAGTEQITSEAIQMLVPRAQEHTSWQLWDAIVRADRQRAFQLMKRLLDDGDTGTPLLVLGALASLYRRLLSAKDQSTRGADSNELARSFGQYGPNASAFTRWFGRTNRRQIVKGLKRIAEVDNAIKNSEATPRLQMEYLIMELTQPVTGGKA